MHVLLIFGRSRAEEALLLSASEDRMRVMRRGQEDATELRHVEGLWMSESGAQVEIAAALPAVQPAWEIDRIARADAALRVGCALDRFGHWLTN